MGQNIIWHGDGTEMARRHSDDLFILQVDGNDKPIKGRSCDVFVTVNGMKTVCNETVQDLEISGANGGNRTPGRLITNQPLYL